MPQPASPVSKIPTTLFPFAYTRLFSWNSKLQVKNTTILRSSFLLSTSEIFIGSFFLPEGTGKAGNHENRKFRPKFPKKNSKFWDLKLKKNNQIWTKFKQILIVLDKFHQTQFLLAGFNFYRLPAVTGEISPRKISMLSTAWGKKAEIGHHRAFFFCNSKWSNWHMFCFLSVRPQNRISHNKCCCWVTN